MALENINSLPKFVNYLIGMEMESSNKMSVFESDSPRSSMVVPRDFDQITLQLKKVQQKLKSLIQNKNLQQQQSKQQSRGEGRGDSSRGDSGGGMHPKHESQSSKQSNYLTHPGLNSRELNREVSDVSIPMSDPGSPFDGNLGFEFSTSDSPNHRDRHGNNRNNKSNPLKDDLVSGINKEIIESII